MTTFFTFTAIAVVFIFFPLLVIWNLTESRSTKIQRARRNGHTWRQIADRYGVSPRTAARWAAA